MRLKLDENLHADVCAALRAPGHDVRTVHEQGLAGHPDADIAVAVRKEKRCLVSFDLGFADVRRYSPRVYAGLVVLRLGAPTARNQVAALTRFFAGEPQLKGRLWIVEENRAREWSRDESFPPGSGGRSSV